MRSIVWWACVAMMLLGYSSLYGQRNVVVIIADDLGVDYIGLYGEGSDPAPTPVLDSLANSGILFENAWTNPICSPSRANILAGKYAFRTGIGTAITSTNNATLDTSEYTVPKAVKHQTGAATAMFGKWHLGHQSQAFRLNPNRCGFDKYSGAVEGQLSNYSIWQKTTDGSNSLELTYATTANVNDAIDWVDDQNDDWLVFLSFNAPHEPFHRPPNNLHSFDNLPTNQTTIDNNPSPYYKAMIEAMDTEIGRFLLHLRNSGELAQTDIIFIGDNGTPSEVVLPPFDPNEAKSTVYLGGVRVPLVVSGPSVISPGRTTDALVNSTDLYHTILEMFGGNPATLPADAATDSRSIMDLLTNSPDSGNLRSYIYADLFKPTTNFKDGKTITDGIYKLIEFDNGVTEFYHIAADPFEDNGLDVQTLSSNEQDHYDFLCNTLSTLLDSNFCQIPLGLFDQEIQAIQGYPNPARSTYQLTVNADGSSYTNWEVQLYGAHGALVRDYDAEWRGQTLTITTEQLPSGAYYLILLDRSKAIGVSTFMRQ